MNHSAPSANTSSVIALRHHEAEVGRVRLKKRGEPPGAKEQLLCELEQYRTLALEKIRSLEGERRELEQAKESFQAFYSQSPVGYILLTERGQIREPNSAATRLLAMPRERLNHLPFTLLVHLEDMQRFLAHVALCRQARGKKVTTELRLRAPVEEPLRIQLVSVPIVQSTERLFLTATIDVSDRNRSEKELAESKEFSESIVETVNQPLAVLDADFRIVSVNRAFGEFFKCPPEFVRDRMFEVLLNLWWSGNDLRAELEKVLVKDKPLENFQITTELRDGSKHALLLNARRLFGKRGSRPLILVALEDITLRKQAEEKLRQLNQELESRVTARTDALKRSNEQMEAFCYSIAHDLRAPLRSMTGFSTLLLSEHATNFDDTVGDYVERIKQSAERMDQLIGGLLDYGRLATSGVEILKVNMEEVFRSVLRQHDQEIKEKRATITKLGSLPPVQGHPITLQTIFANLLLNAMKFVAPGVAPSITVHAEDRGTFARFWVEDNGIGIAPEHRAKVFGVFQRLHSNDRYPGTGIGLAIVQKGIERMGGSVGVESEKNKGSRFWFELRKAEPAKESSKKKTGNL